ncbi:uncharacterized protein METZ01_LOCUS98541, partial [marine metagenome]
VTPGKQEPAGQEPVSDAKKGDHHRFGKYGKEVWAGPIGQCHPKPVAGPDDIGVDCPTPCVRPTETAAHRVGDQKRACTGQTGPPAQVHVTVRGTDADVEAAERGE